MPVLHEHIEGKYEILGKLREGGMGAVYKVRHRLLDEIRVVKVLNPRLDVTPELSDRFLREARFAIQLRHPNIAQLHDFSIAEDGSAFIVMEFIDGATLEEIVARTGPPPLGLGLEIARQSLKAIGFLHRRGLIHRDISPDNLMLARDPDGEPLVKMIDLGIAKVLKSGAGGLTSTGMFLGKPRYASPEQFGAEGMSGVDARADLYSFGVVLYELLTGVCPIQGRDPSSLMAGHLFRPPVDFAASDPEGRLPSDLREILLRSLAKKPDERYSASAEELSLALREIQNRFPVQLGDLDAALAAAVVPVPAAAPPGSTQEKLDQQFAKVATPAPAPTVRSEPRRDSTLVLAPLARTAVREEKEAPPVSREPTTPPVAAPAVPSPPKMSAPPPPPPPRVEAPRLPRRAAPEPRSGPRSEMIVALLILGLAATFLGFWWWFSHPAPVEPPPGLVAEVRLQNAPPVSPEIVPSIPPPPPPPAAEPVGSTAASVAPSALPPASPQKPVSRPEPRTSASAPDDFPAPKPRAPATPPLPEPAVPAPSSQVTPAVPTPGQPSEKPDDQGPQKVDTKARLVSVPTPTFPAAYKGTGTYARILVAVRSDESGKVIETRVKNAYIEEGTSALGPVLGGPAFRDAAQEAASKARFEPALRNGQPVASWMDLTFEFGRRPRR